MIQSRLRTYHLPTEVVLSMHRQRSEESSTRLPLSIRQKIPIEYRWLLRG